MVRRAMNRSAWKRGTVTSYSSALSNFLHKGSQRTCARQMPLILIPSCLQCRCPALADEGAVPA